MYKRNGDRGRETRSGKYKGKWRRGKCKDTNETKSVTGYESIWFGAVESCKHR